jgi:hypothetical protein
MAEEFAICADMFPDVRTRRGRQNVIYRLRAVSILKEDSLFRWLVDPDRARQGVPGSWRPSILAELGRIEDREEMLSVALRICQLRPKAKEAVCVIRRARIGGSGSGDAVNLSQVIIRAINEYLAAHPATTRRQVHAALANASGAVAASELPDDQDASGEAANT